MPSSIVELAEQVLSKKIVEQKERNEKQQLHDRILNIEKSLDDNRSSIENIEKELHSLVDILKSTQVSLTSTPDVDSSTIELNGN